MLAGWGLPETNISEYLYEIHHHQLEAQSDDSELSDVEGEDNYRNPLLLLLLLLLPLLLLLLLCLSVGSYYIDKALAVTLLQLCQFVFTSYIDETLAIPLLYQFVLIY